MNKEQLCLEYSDIRHYGELWMFTDPEIPVDEDELDFIKPLTEESSIRLWNEMFSEKLWHAVLLEKEGWTGKNIKWESEYSWLLDWNDNKPCPPILDQICRSEEAIVYFAWGRHGTYETIWRIFKKYWLNFLFNDEGPILFSLDDDWIVQFFPSQILQIGKRISKRN